LSHKEIISFCLYNRLSHVLRGSLTHAKGASRQPSDRHVHVNYERSMLEADKENEHLRAELSTLESQILVLQGALAVVLSVHSSLFSSCCLPR